MAHKKYAPFVALISLLRRRFPDVDHPEELVLAGQVLVDGAPMSNPKASVRAGAAIKVLRPKALRGTIKLAHALTAFGLDITCMVAVDVGAAAGGFTQALLDAGAARVYAVDAGVGQLRGSLRADPRVVNLERTNLGRLEYQLVPEPVDVVVIDLSYLSIAAAVGQLDRLILSDGAYIVVLVKPTFELASGRLESGPQQVAAAVAKAERSLRSHGWKIVAQVPSPITGARGAVEVLVLAQRDPSPPATPGPALIC